MNGLTASRAAAGPEVALPLPVLGQAGFGAATVVARQQQIAEALAAAGQKWLEGAQEVATRSLLLQGALLEQGFMGALNLLQAASPAAGVDPEKAAIQAMEATSASLRAVVDAACRCPLQTLAAFRNRLQAVPAYEASAEASSRTTTSEKRR